MIFYKLSQDSGLSWDDFLQRWILLVLYQQSSTVTIGPNLWTQPFQGGGHPDELRPQECPTNSPKRVKVALYVSSKNFRKVDHVSKQTRIHVSKYAQIQWIRSETRGIHSLPTETLQRIQRGWLPSSRQANTQLSWSQQTTANVIRQTRLQSEINKQRIKLSGKSRRIHQFVSTACNSRVSTEHEICLTTDNNVSKQQILLSWKSPLVSGLSHQNWVRIREAGSLRRKSLKIPTAGIQRKVNLPFKAIHIFFLFVLIFFSSSWLFSLPAASGRHE